MLADIGGRPMIEHVYRRTAATSGVDAVVVATDDARIAAAVESFGGVARMTRAEHRTGTDRIAEVAAGLSCAIVVNVQGDEPLIEPEAIRAAIDPLETDPALEMSTVCRPISDPADYHNPSVVKLVMDREGNALYFSRAPIPYNRAGGSFPRPVPHSHVPVFKHFGIYAFRRTFLLTFARLPQTPLETVESLEQLRALEHGVRIRAAITPHDSIGVDTPEDLERVRHLAVVERT